MDNAFKEILVRISVIEKCIDKGKFGIDLMLVGKSLATDLRLGAIQVFPIKVRSVEKDEVDDQSCRCIAKPR